MISHFYNKVFNHCRMVIILFFKHFKKRDHNPRLSNLKARYNVSKLWDFIGQTITKLLRNVKF